MYLWDQGDLNKKQEDAIYTKGSVFLTAKDILKLPKSVKKQFKSYQIATKIF